MAIYNVRCCCQPQKILGTLALDALEIEAARRAGGLRIVLGATHCFVVEHDMVFSPETTEIHARLYVDGQYQELAIYSDDRPIEFWRRVRGFTENAEEAFGTL